MMIWLLEAMGAIAQNLSTRDGLTARTLVASGETVATAHSLNQQTLNPFNRQLYKNSMDSSTIRWRTRAARQLRPLRIPPRHR